MLRIDFQSRYLAGAKRLPSKHRNQIAKKIEALRHNPMPQDSIALQGKLRQFRRVDVGEYRIIYHFKDDVLFIVVIGKRNDDDIYRRMKRRL